MAMNDIAIRIAADFLGLPAFKKADTAVDKLYKSTTRLASAFGVTFSAVAITRFAASSVRAFAAEERQIATLTTTVKNLGLAFQADSLNAYVEDLERATGITRDQLNPALQKLLTQTGSVTKSQQILSTAVEVSFSGMMSLEEAASALTQAYVGNVKGLKQLNLGLTNAELSAMTFDQILAKINETYKSQFKTAMDNTAIKLDKIKVAADNAKESIGGGLVKAFSDLAGNGNLDAANSKLERMGELLGRIIGNAFNPVKVGGFYLPVPNLLAKDSTQNTIGSPASWRAKNAAIVKAETEAAARLKKIEDAKLKTLKNQLATKRASAAVDKARSALSDAKGMFDLEGIQIQAALQGNITEEQRKRLELMQKIWELEQAVDAGNTALIEKLTAQLELLTSQFAQLNLNFQALEKINDLLDKIGMGRKLFDTENINQTVSLLSQITGQKQTASSIADLVGNDPALAKAILIDAVNAFQEEVVVPDLTSATTAVTASKVASTWDPSMFRTREGAGTYPQVVVQITDNAQKLVDAVTFATQNSSANGTPVALYRNATNLAW